MSENILSMKQSIEEIENKILSLSEDEFQDLKRAFSDNYKTLTFLEGLEPMNSAYKMLCTNYIDFSQRVKKCDVGSYATALSRAVDRAKWRPRFNPHVINAIRNIGRLFIEKPLVFEELKKATSVVKIDNSLLEQSIHMSPCLAQDIAWIIALKPEESVEFFERGRHPDVKSSEVEDLLLAHFKNVALSVRDIEDLLYRNDDTHHRNTLYTFDAIVKTLNFCYDYAEDPFKPYFDEYNSIFTDDDKIEETVEMLKDAIYERLRTELFSTGKFPGTNTDVQACMNKCIKILESIENDEDKRKERIEFLSDITPEYMNINTTR